MTDLEKHWDDLAVGPAPVDAILRRARRTSLGPAATGRRRPEDRLRRSLTTVAVLGGVAAAFVAGTIVPDAGGPDGPVAGGLGGNATPVAFHGELQAKSCDGLLASYVDRSVDLVTKDGWGDPFLVNRAASNWVQEDGLRRLDDFSTARDSVIPRSTSLDQAAGATSNFGKTSNAKSSDTGTNVQETGVDEPDSVKTDGTVLIRLRGAVLTTYDVSGDTLDQLGRLDLGDFHDGEILLAGSTVVAVGNDGSRYSPDSVQGAALGTGAGSPSPQTRVLSVSIDDPAAPRLEQTVDYDAALVAARQHGTDVRVVLSKGLPDLAFEDGATAEENRKLVERTTLDDWLPHVSVDGGESTDLLDCDRVAVPRADLAPATMAVVGFGATTPGTTDALGLAGDAPLTYESDDHLYLAASAPGSSFDGCFDCLRRTTASGSATGASDGTSHVYDFTVDGTGATYVGAGEVEGSIRDRWSMDEYDGVLRVAVGPSTETADASSIVTLRAQGEELVEIGRIDDLGANEDIKAVRWFDGLALVVTFRQIDPLYAVDLTDPTKPVLEGELKIPGFSSYLHPLSSVRVLGIGSDGRNRAQAGFFDVSDLTDVRRLDKLTYAPGTQARAGDDPRQFTWVREARSALTVIARGNKGFVSELHIENGRMTNTMTEVEYGRDVDAVRLVQVGDGKVVLVTGEDVRFFPLA
ncbi:beta-propeller domain-containing protein [Nocardioides plantarum]|uniref:Beta-propeller domain-containing protein n=1 Tax=Nocardioides plantarum TaxID=29299 RepID=A0ABV5K7F5_9ACTN|nr:beta-propeller domain-containing protein [Nocardioides plantarum]